jgi:hypothetical protein
MDATQTGLLPMGDRDFKNKQRWKRYTKVPLQAIWPDRMQKKII